jgi:hypothetical protein
VRVKSELQDSEGGAGMPAEEKLAASTIVKSAIKYTARSNASTEELHNNT